MMRIDSLQVRAIVGGLNLTEFLLDERDLLVYMRDPTNLLSPDEKYLSQKKKEATRVYYDNWFVYIADKPFDFGG